MPPAYTTPYSPKHTEPPAPASELFTLSDLIPARDTSSPSSIFTPTYRTATPITTDYPPSVGMVVIPNETHSSHTTTIITHRRSHKNKTTIIDHPVNPAPRPPVDCTPLINPLLNSNPFQLPVIPSTSKNTVLADFQLAAILVLVMVLAFLLVWVVHVTVRGAKVWIGVFKWFRTNWPRPGARR